MVSEKLGLATFNSIVLRQFLLAACAKCERCPGKELVEKLAKTCC